MKHLVIFLFGCAVFHSSFSQEKIVQCFDKQGLPLSVAEGAAVNLATFSPSFTISDMKELCDTACPEEYLVYEKGGWERANVYKLPYPAGYEKQSWYNQDLNLTITTDSDGHRTLVISTLSREYYEDIRKSLPVNNMKKRLIGYSDGECAMQIYSVAQEYRPGFYYSITMERL